MACAHHTEPHAHATKAWRRRRSVRPIISSFSGAKFGAWVHASSPLETAARQTAGLLVGGLVVKLAVSFLIAAGAGLRLKGLENANNYLFLVRNKIKVFVLIW